MKLGIGSYAYSWSIGVPGNIPGHPMDIFKLIDKAVMYDVPIIQVDDNLPLHTYSIDQLEHIRQYAKDNDVSIEVGSRKLTKEHTLRYLSIADFFKSPFLRMVIDEKDYKPSIPEIIHIIKEIIPEFEKRKIYLAIENHDRFEARVFRDIIEKTNSEYVKICLDSVNSFGAGEGLETVIDMLSPYTINLHLKEFNIERLWHMMGFSIEGKPLGNGMLPVKYLLEKVKKSCISATLELWPPPEGSLSETIKKEDQWVEQSIRYWKKNVAI